MISKSEDIVTDRMIKKIAIFGLGYIGLPTAALLSRNGYKVLGIDINSKALKNKMIEVNTKFKFEDKENSKKKSYFEIIYSTIIQVDSEAINKEKLEKIILCDVQIKIYPYIEKALLGLLHSSGYPDIKFEKKVDFEELYKQKFN